MKVTSLIFLVLFHPSLQKEEYYVTSPWSYENNGPSGPQNWGNIFAECNGSNQSPIDLSGASYNPNLIGLTFSEDYLANVDKKKLSNHGNALVLGIEESVPLVYGGDGLFNDARYHLVEVRFHWGSDTSKGSEHAIEGIKYPLEIQLVHYDSERDDSIEWSLGIPDAIVVFGVVAEVGEEDNEELEKVFGHLSGVEHEGSITIIEKIDFTKFLPNENSFYKYTGSLTMPPCTEEVTWLVFKNPIKVSLRQLVMLRSLKSKYGPLVDNFRYLQDLNGRQIFKSF